MEKAVGKNCCLFRHENKKKLLQCMAELCSILFEFAYFTFAILIIGINFRKDNAKKQN